MSLQAGGGAPGRGARVRETDNKCLGWARVCSDLSLIFYISENSAQHHPSQSKPPWRATSPQRDTPPLRLPWHGAPGAPARHRLSLLHLSLVLDWVLLLELWWLLNLSKTWLADASCHNVKVFRLWGLKHQREPRSVLLA